MEILDAVKTGSSIVRGVKQGDLTKFAVLKISDPQCPQLELVIEELNTLERTSSLVYHQYAFDGAVYFYFFLSEWAHSDTVNALLSGWLELLNIGIDSNLMRVMTTDEAIPLPLQAGFNWCGSSNRRTIRRDDLNLEDAFDLFLSDSARSMNFESFSEIFTKQSIALVGGRDESTKIDKSSGNSIFTQSSGTILEFRDDLQKRVEVETINDATCDSLKDSTGQSRQDGKKMSRRSRQSMKSPAEPRSPDKLSYASYYSQLSLPILESTTELRAPPYFSNSNFNERFGITS